MMHALSCARVREDLPAFLDDELPLDEQVPIQGHLQECVACRLEASELSEIGHALRAASTSMAASCPSETGRLTSAVLDRVRLEEQLSFRVQIRGLFDDMHFVWAGLGASLAMIICIFASASVLHATNRERPDSLAGLIDYLANPGSNANPARLDEYMLAPRVVLDTSIPATATAEDADLAFAAVVTREGRIQNLELVEEQPRAVRAKPEVIHAMLDAAARARFEPAMAGGAPVAVSMVWLLSTTTVKGSPDYDMYLLRPPRWLSASGPSAPPKPRPTPPPVKVSPTGDGGLAG